MTDWLKLLHPRLDLQAVVVELLLLALYSLYMC